MFRVCLFSKPQRLAGNLIGLLALAAWLAARPVSAQQTERVAVFEQWPGVSQLIAYRDRLWLVNSQPFRDNNSADIYSFSITDMSVRYERSLFSQDVGAPVVFDGLLHWPFEDPRRSAGSGEYAVTDGTRWEWRAMPSGSVMHVHAMNVCDGDLVAATGSWAGQLHRQVSNDHWEVQYEYPAAPSSFSRVVSVAQLAEECIVGTSARNKEEPKMFVLQGNERRPISGWPASDRVDNLTQHQRALFAFVDSGSQRKLMRYDGLQSHEIKLPDNLRPRAMHSDGVDLWLVTHDPDASIRAGGLWKYGGNKFRLLSEFSHTPISLSSLNGVVAIGTYSQSGGWLLLYRDRQALTTEKPVEARSLERGLKAKAPDEALVDSLYSELLDLVVNPLSTENYARTLRRNLGRHPMLTTPEFGAALTRVLSVGIKGAPTTMFTGQMVSRQDLIRWFLITTLAINGNGRVNPEWINRDNPIVVPDSGKVFDPSIASIVAVGWLQQDDRETLDALFTRLNNKQDPKWVKADVIGALTALTDQRFGYDVAAWNSWWRVQ